MEWHSVAEGSLSALAVVMTARSDDWRVIAACQLANALMLLFVLAPTSQEMRRCWSHMPPRRSPRAIDLVLLAYWVLMLVLHAHHLHALIHPREDTWLLLGAEIFMCARHLIVAEVIRLHIGASQAREYFYNAAAASSTPTAATEPTILAGDMGFVILLNLLPNAAILIGKLWMRLTTRSLSHMTAFTLPWAAQLLLSYSVVPLKEATFSEQLCSILFASTEAAFTIGAVPAFFAWDEPILHEHHESLRIGALVFTNTLFLSLLHVLGSKPTADGTRASASAPTASARTAADSIDIDVTASPEMWLRFGLHGLVRDPGRTLPAAAKDSKLWRLYLRHTDSVQLGLMYAQSLIVCGLLLEFFYTFHWRSHAISLVVNYAVLYECIRFRRAGLGVAAPGDFRP